MSVDRLGVRSGDLDGSRSDEIARTLTGNSERAAVGEAGRFFEGDGEVGISNSVRCELPRRIALVVVGDGDPELGSSGRMLMLISCWR